MSDEINKDMSHPLYEFTQVITHEELHALVEELFIAYCDTPWIKWRDKLKLAGGFSTAKILLNWMHAGKPYDVTFMQHSRGTGGNHETLDN